MTSRKFNPYLDSDKQTIPWATALRATYGTTTHENTSARYLATNYGKFSIKFQGAKIWNSLSEETKSIHRLAFKKTFKKGKSYNPIDIQ